MQLKGEKKMKLKGEKAVRLKGKKKVWLKGEEESAVKGAIVAKKRSMNSSLTFFLQRFRMNTIGGIP